MPRQPDALKGLKHHTGEALVTEVALRPYDHYTPPEQPNALSVRVFNLNPTATYVLRIYEVVDSVTIRPRSKS